MFSIDDKKIKKKRNPAFCKKNMLVVFSFPLPTEESMPLFQLFKSRKEKKKVSPF